MGVQAMLIYMAVYVTMNIGTFAFILSMEKDGKPGHRHRFAESVFQA
jgi:NADH-quinone oxidoreductase subunit N